MSPTRRSAADDAQLRESLIGHARRLVARDGPAALTMRALAAEAGCAVGLPYKVFADRHQLVVEIVHAELGTLRAACDELAGRAGTLTLGGNLTWFAEVFLDSPAVALAHEIVADDGLIQQVHAGAREAGLGPAEFPAVLAGYLAAERRAGRVARGADPDAVGYLLASALHNLVVAGPAWPRPSRADLRAMLDALAATLSPAPEAPDDRA